MCKFGWSQIISGWEMQFESEALLVQLFRFPSHSKVTDITWADSHIGSQKVFLMSKG